MSLVPAAQSNKESTSSNVLSKESSIVREELISKDNVVIESTKPENQQAQYGLRSGLSQLEETTRPTISAGMSQEKREMSGEVVSRGRQGRQ